MYDLPESKYIEKFSHCRNVKEIAALVASVSKDFFAKHSKIPVFAALCGSDFGVNSRFVTQPTTPTPPTTPAAQPVDPAYSAALRRAYQVIHEYEEFDNVLESTKSLIVTKFKRSTDTERRDIKLSDATITAIDDLRDLVADKIEAAYANIKASGDKVPLAVKKRIDEVRRLLNKHAATSGKLSKTVTNFFTENGICTYLGLDNVSNDRGYVFPKLYVVLTGNYVTILYDRKSPGTFNPGLPYSPDTLSNILTHHLGGTPITQRKAIPFRDVGGKRNLAQFGVHKQAFPFVSDFRVLNDELVARIDVEPDTDETQLQTNIDNLTREVTHILFSSLTGGKRDKISIMPRVRRSKIRNKPVVMVSWVLVGPQGGKSGITLNTEKINKAATLLGLTPSDLQTLMLHGSRYVS